MPGGQDLDVLTAAVRGYIRRRSRPGTYKNRAGARRRPVASPGGRACESACRCGSATIAARFDCDQLRAYVALMYVLCFLFGVFMGRHHVTRPPCSASSLTRHLSRYRIGLCVLQATWRPRSGKLHWLHQLLQAQDGDLQPLVRVMRWDASRHAQDLTVALDRLAARPVAGHFRSGRPEWWRQWNGLRVH